MTNEEYITVEDINTWKLKYREIIRRNWEVAEVNIVNDLYIGCDNLLESIIDIEPPVPHQFLINGREITNLHIDDEDYKEGDTVNILLKTETLAPYLAINCLLQVPVVTKVLESLEDLNSYNYGLIGTLEDLEGTVNIKSHLKGENPQTNGIYRSKLTFKEDTIIENLTIEDCIFVSEKKLTVKNCAFQGYVAHERYVHAKGDSVEFIDCSFDGAEEMLYNETDCTITNAVIRLHVNRNNPFIHNTGRVVMLDSQLIGIGQTTGFGLCFIRTKEKEEAEKIFDIENNNTSNYNLNWNIEGRRYSVKGTGYAYCLIDDDTVYLHDLEIEENEQVTEENTSEKEE